MILNQVAVPFLLVSTMLLAIGGGCAAPAEIPPASEEGEKGLFWQGPAKGVLTTINIRLPAIDSLTYKAWEDTVGHCHAHVWWGEP